MNEQHEHRWSYLSIVQGDPKIDKNSAIFICDCGAYKKSELHEVA